MRLEVDKERFKGFFEQFNDDIPFQIELIQLLLSNLPEQVTESLISDLYFERCYKGEVYKLQHITFKDDVHYFTNYDTMVQFLLEHNMYSDKSKFTNGNISRRITRQEPLCGYMITKEVKK